MCKNNKKGRKEEALKLQNEKELDRGKHCFFQSRRHISNNNYYLIKYSIFNNNVSNLQGYLEKSLK